MQKSNSIYNLLGLLAYGIFCFLSYQVVANYKLGWGLLLFTLAALIVSKGSLQGFLSSLRDQGKKELPFRIVYFLLYFAGSVFLMVLYRRIKPMEIITNNLYNTAYFTYMGLSMFCSLDFLVRYFFRKDLKQMKEERKNKGEN